MQIAFRIYRKFVPPSPPFVVPEANTKHTESDSGLWKVAATAAASDLLSAEDCLLILFGFISGCAIASNFSQILGLFA